MILVLSWRRSAWYLSEIWHGICEMQRWWDLWGHRCGVFVGECGTIICGGDPGVGVATINARAASPQIPLPAFLPSSSLPKYLLNRPQYSRLAPEATDRATEQSFVQILIFVDSFNPVNLNYSI